MNILNKKIGPLEAQLSLADQGDLADDRPSHKMQGAQESNKTCGKTGGSAGQIGQAAGEQADEHSQVVSRFKNAGDPLNVVGAPGDQVGEIQFAQSLPLNLADIAKLRCRQREKGHRGKFSLHYCRHRQRTQDRRDEAQRNMRHIPMGIGGVLTVVGAQHKQARGKAKTYAQRGCRQISFQAITSMKAPSGSIIPAAVPAAPAAKIQHIGEFTFKKVTEFVSEFLQAARRDEQIGEESPGRHQDHF